MSTKTIDKLDKNSVFVYNNKQGPLKEGVKVMKRKLIIIVVFSLLSGAVLAVQASTPPTHKATACTGSWLCPANQCCRSGFCGGCKVAKGVEESEDRPQ